MQWQRDTRELDFSDTRLGRVLHEVIPRVRLRSRDATGPLRVGLWAGDTRLAGWSVPFLPPNAILLIDGNRATGMIDGEQRDLPAFVRDWDGGFPRSVVLPYGTYTLTLDQDAERVVEVIVDVTMAASGA